MHPIKAISCFSAFLFLSTGLAFAQSTKPNRQQELYDEHHGINQKTKVFTPETPDSQRNKSRRANDGQSADGTEPQASVPVSSASGVRIGVRGGLTYPVYTKKPVAPTVIDPNLGFVGGITFNFGQGALSFQPEVNYTRYAIEYNLGFGKTAAASDLIEVPLFLKISSGTYEGNRFFVNVGPYASYQASSSIEGKKITFASGSGANRFGFGAALGVGTALKAGPGHVTVEVRGLYPLGNFNDGFRTDANVVYGQATVGYIVPLGGR